MADAEIRLGIIRLAAAEEDMSTLLRSAAVVAPCYPTLAAQASSIRKTGWRRARTCASSSVPVAFFRPR